MICSTIFNSNNFNSNMVQLKQRLYLRLSQSHHVFQFHASTIKTICTLDVSLRLLNFNSIMVQLKLGLIATYIGLFQAFQFHNGTIKTDYSFILPAILPKFQFHNGTIKTHRHL